MSKVTVITGASRGLGLAMAQRLSSESIQVESWDLHPPEDSKILFREVDVSSEESVVRAAKDFHKEHGVAQHLINNAGITRDALFHKMTLEDLELTWKVNLLGAQLVTRELGSAMRAENSALLKQGKRAPWHRIIGISSVAGVFGNVGQANYAASKAGLVAFVKSLAKEWGPLNISATAIAPGIMKTQMTESIPEKIVQSFVERTPLRRMGEASELAGFVAYLCREESAFLTGDVITFSGALLL